MENNLNETEETKPDAEQTEKSSSAGVKVRKIINIVLDVLLYVFLAFSIFLLITSIVSKRNDGAANFFGHEMRVVASSSMEWSDYTPEDVKQFDIKQIKIRSMVFIERVPYNAQEAQEWYSRLKVGDVLTFRYLIASSQETITHRITEITPTDSGYIISLQGDNRSEGSSVATQTIYTSSADYPNQNAIYNYVLGKVTGQSVVLGNIAFATSNTVGMACIIIVPCVIIIVWQVMRIVIAFGDDRKAKAAAKIAEAEKLAETESKEREKQALELEQLKRKIAELEKQKPDGGDNGSDGQT